MRERKRRVLFSRVLRLQPCAFAIETPELNAVIIGMTSMSSFIAASLSNGVIVAREKLEGALERTSVTDVSPVGRRRARLIRRPESFCLRAAPACMLAPTALLFIALALASGGGDDACTGSDEPAAPARRHPAYGHDARRGRRTPQRPLDHRIHNRGGAARPRSARRALSLRARQAWRLFASVARGHRLLHRQPTNLRTPALDGSERRSARDFATPRPSRLGLRS